MTNSVIFRPITLNKVEFKNRILRSSVGGRMSNYDATVTDVWKNFEKRFAAGGVGGIISTTFHVNQDRVSPLQYPSIAEDKYVPFLHKYIREIKAVAECRYIVQIGDPGYTTYSSLFPDDRDSKSSSSGFDAAFGYNNRRTPLTEEEIGQAIKDFVSAAKRVQETGADGLEITATKGYLIHQFLNPGINRRDDHWGGDADRRFNFLKEIVTKVRAAVGPDFLFGIRLSAADFNYSPIQISMFRFPWSLRREHWMGNDADQMIKYALQLRELKVDFLHVVTGYGFPNPRDTPGRFPFEEIRIFFNSVRHLSFKAAVRAGVVNTLPDSLLRWVSNWGWAYKEGINLDYARRIKRDVGLPVIVNGGFQHKARMEEALSPVQTNPNDDCDMVSMARALIANPCLPKEFEAGKTFPDRPCSYCNKCVGRTTTSPLGCYDVERFPSLSAMQDQIMEWNRSDL